MRKIGSIASGSQAERFHHYLTSRGIQNRVDAVGGSWEVWIYDEEKLPVGREELTAFTADPEAKKYQVKAPPPPVQKQPVRRAARSQGSERLQVTVTVAALAVAITLATDFGKQRELTNDLLLAPSSGNLTSILHGEVWRLFTPMFMHGNWLHLGFGVYMFWILAGAIERVKGTRALLLLILLIAPASHLTQYFWAGPNFFGISGVDYGLFGYLWMRSVLLPEDGFYMPESVVVQMAIWTMLGIFGVIGGIANGAHIGGLVAGMALGAAPRLWRR
ncbi:rhomboid family intramembrane serine protease [Planctomicrobium sp. SH661]|uniref:rhomboid family intramembrane serine protease n=1 Tax=Planctomicrobium sp. SH661 TaxID=3448124 RepID=UPI003F5BD375